MGRAPVWSGAIGLIAIAGAAQAANQGEFHVTPYLGFSKVAVDGQHLEFGKSQDYSGWVAGISAGYHAPFGLIVEIGTSASGDPVFGWASGGELRERYIGAGYDLGFGDDWHFTPKIGLTSWRLDAGDLEQLVDDSGQLADDLDGNDIYLDLGLAKKLNPHVAIGLSLRWADVSVGSASSLAATFTWIP